MHVCQVFFLYFFYICGITKFFVTKVINFAMSVCTCRALIGKVAGSGKPNRTTEDAVAAGIVIVARVVTSASALLQLGIVSKDGGPCGFAGVIAVNIAVMFVVTAGRFTDNTGAIAPP